MTIKLLIPIPFTGRRTLIGPTRNGMIFFGMLFALLLGSINHNNNLGFILTFLLGGMACVSLIHTLRNLFGFIVVSKRAEPVFAGQPASFAILVDTPGPRPNLSFAFTGGRPSIENLQAEGPHVFAVLHDTAKRGLLQPDRINVATTYPLGLFLARTSFPFQGSCLVYPRPIAGPMVTAPTEGEDEVGEKSGGSGVDDFEGLQAYQPGDPMQHISWKAYSRGQGLHTKKFEGRQGRTLLFSLETLPGRDLEQKLSRICFMILRADALHLVYGLQLGKTIIAPDLGGPHRRKCLREIALMQP